jgi:uncharacterized damage-inducible protein DinB
MKFRSMMILAACFGTCALHAQTANPVTAGTKRLYEMVKVDIVKTAAKVPESLYSFKPTPEVRSFGELIGHVADSQYEFCGPVKGETKKSDIEHTKKSKADLTAALNEAFAYCDAAYNSMTDAAAGDKIQGFGPQGNKLFALNFNTAHANEHYGNLVTYMRLKGIVPPSSESQGK